MEVIQQGADGINFETFKITCDNDKFVDLVTAGGCPGSLWFDKKDAGGLSVTTDDPCYAQGASQRKTGHLDDGKWRVFLDKIESGQITAIFNCSHLVSIFYLFDKY